MKDINDLKNLVKDFRVLYVEDNLEVYNVVKSLLERVFKSENVNCVFNGKEAFELYKKSRYDIVITDIKMPEMDGIELVKEIKSINKEQTIIVTSAHEESEYFIELINSGITMFLLKPLKFKDMLKIIYDVAKEINNKKELKRLQFKEIREKAIYEILHNIAHHWRQPLNALGIILQSLNKAYNRGKLTKEYLSEKTTKSMELINNMSFTINDFIDFFKPETKEESFNLSKVIKNSLNLLEANLNNNGVNVEIDLNDKIRVFGFISQFSQVILSIITNSIDAFIDRKIEKKKLIIKSYIENEKIYLTISDNAKGIKESLLDKIFEPYFSTKDNIKSIGTGTGIGLYMSKIIIEKNMNGKIYAKNIDHGAEFVIELPLLCAKE